MIYFLFYFLLCPVMNRDEQKKTNTSQIRIGFHIILYCFFFALLTLCLGAKIGQNQLLS